MRTYYCQLFDYIHFFLSFFRPFVDKGKGKVPPYGGKTRAEQSTHHCLVQMLES